MLLPQGKGKPHKHLVQGQKFTRLYVGSDALLKDWLKSKHIFAVNTAGDEQVIRAEDLYENPANREDAKPIKGGGENVEDARNIKEAGIKTGAAPSQGASQPLTHEPTLDAPKNPVAPEPVHQVDSPWVCDPEDLKDKDLDTLNSMVAERWPVEGDVPEFAPYATAEEAISVLSYDFEKNRKALCKEENITVTGGESEESEDTQVATG